ncbi:erythrocyte vesicle protein 1, putative [Plasmodium relictum]|uniref:Erythrocyte vesicle protein 1, putative n=1 Tax=Plasmodium relictum TaxID=85471 RepID=A0A1J1H589_PLARL|nr:erythrocyte vesicle protein 1, putative [Plasmodium relictum]CRG98587.1 erythrocyte vesicle protein 1, putative [Plasmodium relictum]
MISRKIYLKFFWFYSFCIIKFFKELYLKYKSDTILNNSLRILAEYKPLEDADIGEEFYIDPQLPMQKLDMRNLTNDVDDSDCKSETRSFCELYEGNEQSACAHYISSIEEEIPLIISPKNLLDAPEENKKHRTLTPSSACNVCELSSELPKLLIQDASKTEEDWIKQGAKKKIISTASYHKEENQEAKEKKREKTSKNFFSLSKVRSLFKKENKNDEFLCENKDNVLETKPEIVRSSDIIEDLNIKKEKKIYENLFTRFVALVLIFYENKNEIDSMSQFLPQKYMDRYIEVEKEIIKISNNVFSSKIHELSKRGEGVSIMHYSGIPRYYILFDYIISTFYFFLYEIIQKKKALLLYFKPLKKNEDFNNPSKFKEIYIEGPYKNIYYATLTYYNSIFKSANDSIMLHFHMWNNKTISAIKKRDPKWVESEKENLSLYLKGVKDNLKYINEDFTSYIKLLFNQARENELFCDSGLFSYSIFFNYYLSAISTTLEILDIHIQSSSSKDFKRDLSQVKSYFQDHMNDVQEHIYMNFSKNYKTLISKELIECFMYDDRYRQRISNSYKDKHEKFISLLPYLTYYLNVIIAEATLLIYLQNIYYFFDDLSLKNIRFSDASEFTKFLERHGEVSAQVFSAFEDTGKKYNFDN